MANDLSKIIQETLVSIINTNISKDINISEILRTTKDSLIDKNLAIAKVNINFNDINNQVNFIYPAYISSYIFNCIMLEDGELLLDINDDIKDAIKEVNNQISGSLETSINAEEFDEIKECKTSFDNIILEDGNNYEPNENLILIKLKIENKDFNIYLEFNDEILPYVDEIMNSKVDENNYDSLNKQVEVEKEDEEDNKDTEDSVSDSNDESSKENLKNENNNNESNETNKEETTNKDSNDKDNIVNEKKDKKLKILIIAIASLLLLIIIAIVVMYFTGMFEPVKTKHTDNNKTKLSKKDTILANIKNKQITYNSNMIDVKKLNKRLSLLTKYEILEDDILAKYKLEEKERLYKLKMKQLEEFAFKNQEESIYKKDILKTIKQKNRFLDINNSSSKVANDKFNNEKLIFIQIDASKYKKYKNFINKEKTKQTQISMCMDNYKTKVYIGPLYINILVNNLMNGIEKQDAKIINITKQEFDKRCDF